jgi:hypothetical protein
MVTKTDVVTVVDAFVNQYGLWPKFKSFVESQGYTVKELGFPDEDETPEEESL